MSASEMTKATMKPFRRPARIPPVVLSPRHGRGTPRSEPAPLTRPIGPLAEERVKSLVTWTSISYACGFFIVLLHTWRLGLPVIELIHPIYVWIGVPLAMFGYFLDHIFGYFQRGASEAMEDVRTGWSRATGLDASGDLSDDLLKALRPALFLGPLSYPVARLMNRWLCSVATKEDQRAKQLKTPADYAAWSTHLRRLLGWVHMVLAVARSFTLLVYALYLGLLVMLYVWTLYPQIPQSLGGGKPSSATLVVEASALPTSLLARTGGLAMEATEKATVSLPVWMLYGTKEAYFVRVRTPSNEDAKTAFRWHVTGETLSIKAETVKSISWGGS
nr:hypothetical protein [Cupriavidus taiwanensis]